MEPVICTYQGSFSPPTIGHEDAARIIATKLIEIYPRAEITLLFMPTANIGSKESISIKKASETPSDEQMEMFSDYVSEKERIALLTIICEKLTSTRKKINRDNTYLKKIKRNIQYIVDCIGDGRRQWA